MQPIQIKTHQTKNSYDELSLFVLSKGANAGKPLTGPCPNCFVIKASSADEKMQLHWICYMLWKNGTFKRFLIGSVIEFIRISDFRKCIENALSSKNLCTKLEKLIQTLQQVDEHQQNLQRQIILLDELKKELMRDVFH